MDPYVICKREVEPDHQAIECDYCEEWEHVECVKECDRPSEELYQALVKCRSTKTIQFVCSRCRKKESVMKRMLEKDCELTHVSSELAHATDEKLASTRQLESSIRKLELKESKFCDLRAELRELRDENKSLNEKVMVLTEKLGKVKSEPVADIKPDVSEEHSSGGRRERRVIVRERQ